MVSATNYHLNMWTSSLLETDTDMSETVLTATSAAAVEHRQTDVYLAVSILSRKGGTCLLKLRRCEVTAFA